MARLIAPICRLGPALVRASLTLVGLTLAATPALAGSITADSVMDKSGARQEAMGQMPKGAIVTKTKCQEIEVHLDNIRYRCTVWYTDPPAIHPTPTPGPTAPQSPTPGS
jgi:hypothetical protein